MISRNFAEGTKHDSIIYRPSIFVILQMHWVWANYMICSQTIIYQTGIKLCLIGNQSNYKLRFQDGNYSSWCQQLMSKINGFGIKKTSVLKMIQDLLRWKVMKISSSASSSWIIKNSGSIGSCLTITLNIHENQLLNSSKETK